MAHWKQSFDTNYIGSYALNKGEIITVTIAKIATEKVKDQNGKEESVLVAHFKESDRKPLILNKTNCKTISKLAGDPDTNAWIGLRIRITSKKVQAFGELVDALRVLNEKVKDEPEIPCESCGKPIQPAYSMTAKQFAELSYQRTGKRLCSVCAEKLKEEKKNDSDGK